MPKIFDDEQDLLAHAVDIDLLVIATPNYMHTKTIQRWADHDVTILCEKPVAVSLDQRDQLIQMLQSSALTARLWIAMEYRYIPAIAQLLHLLPTIGDIKMVTIRENRYPFLHKVGSWNRNSAFTGDTLVEKCCHFFDLFRLITGKEVILPKVKAMAQRGINYTDEMPPPEGQKPIIDAAYVMFPMKDADASQKAASLMGCLELCMYAEGSRHQEEIIVTATHGRLEAYLPENKVYAYYRPTQVEWPDRSVPPPKSVVREQVYDCTNVNDIHGIESKIPTHGGYHYSSTAVEWYQLLQAMHRYQDTGLWKPDVSLSDGLKAVEIGLQATAALDD
jgi:predicted dehydrogenase